MSLKDFHTYQAKTTPNPMGLEVSKAKGSYIYDSKGKKRTWIGVQCKRGYVSKPEKAREVKSAMRKYGMIMFYSTPKKEKKTEIEFYPDFKNWLDKWIKSN